MTERSITDAPLRDRYRASLEWLERAERVIPLGSQTFSKSRTQLPVGAAPLFATEGKGARIRDVDGNEYIDYVCSLGAITLGHGDPDVRAAIVNQLDSGTLFSLPHPLETEVAERIVRMVPCAEMVRFGKNGSDVTAAAIRLARAYTGRDHVAICGYHGWQDWYIGTTARDLGVPAAVKAMSHTFPYNDLEALDRLLSSQPDGFAAVIMEPVAFEDPQPGYLEGVREVTHRHGALLVFDEIVTGFRLTPGTAQELYGVTPDLATLGKGLANGLPLSAIVGRADIMRLMEEIFFSFTMGGEALSLAAARAVLDKIAQGDVLTRIAAMGERLRGGVEEGIERHGLTDVVGVRGHPAWTLFTFADVGTPTPLEMKTLFIQECARRGVLNIGLHFISFAHDETIIDETLAVYEEVFAVLRQALERRDARSLLQAPPLEPLFQVRK